MLHLLPASSFQNDRLPRLSDTSGGRTIWRTFKGIGRAIAFHRRSNNGGCYGATAIP
jgi:hypothetical protein